MSQGKESETSIAQAVSRRAFMKKAAAGAGAVAFGGVLAGCGGSSSSSSPASTQNTTASSSAWKFGIMSDTQWTAPPGDDGADPNTSAMSIGTQIQQQFINQGVKLVVHVGDLCDDGSTAGNKPARCFPRLSITRESASSRCVAITMTAPPMPLCSRLSIRKRRPAFIMPPIRSVPSLKPILTCSKTPAACRR